MLLLQPDAPHEYCPAMNPNTIVNFMHFKFEANKGEVLLDRNQIPVVDIFGAPVICQVWIICFMFVNVKKLKIAINTNYYHREDGNLQ